MVGLAQGTLVVVADSEKVLFLRNLTDAAHPNLAVEDQDAQDNPAARAQSSDRPGRQAQIGTATRAAYQETDWHELEKARFAHDLADKLYQQAHRGAFDRLVIVAAPQVLGVLRAALHPEVKQKIVAEIDKTLTGHPRDQIERLVMRHLAEA